MSEPIAISADSNLPILYSFRRCPYAMRARLAIMSSGKKVRLREILLRNKPEEMLAASPKGTTPVVILPDGQVIDESLDIMFWALQEGDGQGAAGQEGAGQDAARDPEGWLTPDQGCVDDMRALIAENDGYFKHHLDRYKYTVRYEDADRDSHRDAGAVFLRDLNKRLSSNRFLFGSRHSLADSAIFPFVRQFRIADMNWFDEADWPDLSRWLQLNVESPMFVQAMEKFPVWADTNEEFLFP